MKRNQSAITLISLIITIIILLILAGVTIKLALGENGIFKLAEQAGENHMIASNKEQEEIGKTNMEIDKYLQGGNRNTPNKYDLLWSGEYNTSVYSNSQQTSGGCPLKEGYNIENYDCLIIVCTCYGSTHIKPSYCSTIFPVEILKENYGYPACDFSTYANTSYMVRMNIGFLNNSTFYIANKTNQGWDKVAISHIYGVKF